MSKKPTIVSVESLFTGNPLRTLFRKKDGKSTSSYKSNTNKYLLECKKCSEQIERRGTGNATCSCELGTDDAGKLIIVESTSDKELAMKATNLKRDPKQVYDPDLAEDETKERRSSCSC